MMDCPVCGRDADLKDGVFQDHYTSGLFRCENSGQKPVTLEAPKAAPKKAAPRKAAPKK